MLFGLSYGAVVLIILSIVPVTWLAVKAWERRVSDKAKVNEHEVRKIAKKYYGMTDKDYEKIDREKELIFSGYKDGDDMVKHLRAVADAILAEKHFSLRASEAVFLASELGEHIVKSDDGKYFIVNIEAIKKYLDEIRKTGPGKMAKKLSKLERTMKLKRTDDGKIIVDASMVLHRVRNQQGHEPTKNFFVEFGVAKDLEKDVLDFVAVKPDRFEKLVENKAERQRMLRERTMIQRDEEGNREYKWRDGSTFIVYADGSTKRIMPEGAEEKEPTAVEKMLGEMVRMQQGFTEVMLNPKKDQGEIEKLAVLLAALLEQSGHKDDDSVAKLKKIAEEGVPVHEASKTIDTVIADNGEAISSAHASISYDEETNTYSGPTMPEVDLDGPGLSFGLEKRKEKSHSKGTRVNKKIDENSKRPTLSKRYTRFRSCNTRSVQDADGNARAISGNFFGPIMKTSHVAKRDCRIHSANSRRKRTVSTKS